MSGNRLRIGLVGIGRSSGYGRIFAEHPACEVTACCDASDAALARFQTELGLPDSRCFPDYERFLDAGMDAVFLGTPMPLHAEETVKAVEAGLHVLSEVTAASTIEGCRRIVEAVRRTGKVYMLAENCLFWPFVQEWKRMVSSGKLGEVFYAECEYLHPIPGLIFDRKTGQPHWRADRAPLHYCSHSLGPILEITGDRIVRGMGFGQGHRLLPEAPVGGIDMQIALFETERGTLIKLLRSSVVPRHPALHFFLVQGTRGFLESDRHKTGGTGQAYLAGETKEARELPCPLVDASLPKSAQAGGHGTAEYSLVQEFVRALQTGQPAAIDLDRAMAMTVPGLIAHESAMKGGVWLDVPRLA